MAANLRPTWSLSAFYYVIAALIVRQQVTQTLKPANRLINNYTIYQMKNRIGLYRALADMLFILAYGLLGEGYRNRGLVMSGYRNWGSES